MTRKVLGWVLGGALTIGGAQYAAACAFHGYTPSPTLVDRLLETEQVVIARADPANPRRYLPVETLLGPETAEIEIPVSKANRAQLKARASATVLLARDGAYGPWLELTVMDDRFRAVIGQVMARQSAWALGRDKERLSVFAKLVNDPNPDLRRLALKELDRASYGDLRKVRLPVVRNLRADLERGDSDLTPIRVLLAGLSRDDSFAPYLAPKLARAVQSDLPYMGAFATAMIEQGGQAAVKTILQQYLRDDALPMTKKEKLLEALALQHKTAPRALRRYIATQLAELLRDTPALKAPAARQFGFVSQ